MHGIYTQLVELSSAAATVAASRRNAINLISCSHHSVRAGSVATIQVRCSLRCRVATRKSILLQTLRADGAAARQTRRQRPQSQPQPQRRLRQAPAVLAEQQQPHRPTARNRSHADAVVYFGVFGLVFIFRARSGIASVRCSGGYVCSKRYSKPTGTRFACPQLNNDSDSQGSIVGMRLYDGVCEEHKKHNMLYMFFLDIIGMTLVNRRQQIRRPRRIL